MSCGHAIRTGGRNGEEKPLCRKAGGGPAAFQGLCPGAGEPVGVEMLLLLAQRGLRRGGHPTAYGRAPSRILPRFTCFCLSARQIHYLCRNGSWLIFIQARAGSGLLNRCLPVPMETMWDAAEQSSSQLKLWKLVLIPGPLAEEPLSRRRGW